MKENCGIVILSGGSGRRMGYVNKADLDYHGRSFAGQIMEELSGLGLPFFLSTGIYGNPTEIPDNCTAILDRPVDGQQGHIGPMGGIRSCFLETNADGLLFVPCDMPLIRAEMGRRLMERWTPEYDAVIWKTRDGRIQPLCGFYSRTCLTTLDGCIGEGNYRMMEFLSRISCLVLETGREHLPDRWFLNVNDRDAYGRLERTVCPVLAVSGSKNTGKTTLLERLVSLLASRGIRAAVIKHDGHEFEADVPGTDSFRMKQAGAYGTVVYSGSKFSMVKEQPGLQADAFFSFFPEADLILLEGQKQSDYPKIEVLRQEVSRKPVCDRSTVLAYVTDGGWEPDMDESAARTETPEHCKVPETIASNNLDAILEVIIHFLDSADPDNSGSPKAAKAHHNSGGHAV